jgi:DNA-binding PadR family transcriptional regulator
MDVQIRILELLFEKKKMNYRDITDSGIHPNIARRELDKLIRKRLVIEEGRENWKRGKKLFYSLTKKGRETYIHAVFDSASKALKAIQQITDIMLSDPKQLIDWKKARFSRIKALKTSEPKTVEELNVEMYQIHGPLHEGYKNLHKIILLLSLPPELYTVPMFIGITEKDSLYLIPNQLIEDAHLGLVGVPLRYYAKSLLPKE